MANKIKHPVQCKYKINMIYLDIHNGKQYEFPDECIKMIIIDNDYDELGMPMVFASLALDKRLIDNMIKFVNENLIIMAISKYDDLSQTKEEITCIRETFTYYLPNNVNANNDIDYNEETEEEMSEQTFKEITVGMLAIKHVNNNKQSNEINVTNSTMYDIVKYVMMDFGDVILEPFSDNTLFTSFMQTTQDSVSKTLAALNDYRVFYKTPYRYFQDFDYAYVISSSGNPIKKKTEKYDTVVVQIKDILNDEANDVGYFVNDTNKTYQVPVSYINTDVFDNSIANKSKNTLESKSNNGKKTKKLKNVSKYGSKTKKTTIRLNNDNEGMLDNIEAESNNNNFFLYISKNDLDLSLFTINKRISVKNIDRYKEFDGTYLMYRKRDCFIKEDDSFVLNEMINLKRIG